ncbi:hypothetical protein NDU88_000273 [Pleurodeles waltl]|uniref:Uncharacterized protein n=1 Tax=Pleurodeles waltl TaxID=8319 RepID=A0AAV7V503_PLEWA|nr:hypothetical protein NDU88_000273 [Pleurodeles waltl]
MSTGVHQGPLSSTHSASSEFAGPELHLQSSGLVACSRVAPSPRCRAAPTLSLGHASSPFFFSGAMLLSKSSATKRVHYWATGPQPWCPPLSSGRPPSRRLGPQFRPRQQPRSQAGPRIHLGPPTSRSAALPHPD